MKGKMHTYQTDILFYMLLLIIWSSIKTLQIKTGSKISSPEIQTDLNSESSFEMQIQKSNLKQPKNPLIKKETSNLDFFKAFLTDLIKLDSISEKTLLPDKSITNDFNGKISNLSIKDAFKIKSQSDLNFYSEAVKIAEVPKCDLNSCERENGICISETQCKCIYGHINFVTASFKKPCEYRLSFQLYALILEILLPFGVGHFYCKRYLIGFIKFLVLLVIPGIAFFVNRKLLSNEAEKNLSNKLNREISQTIAFVNFKNIISYSISVCFFIVFLVWYLFDIVIFIANRHKDGSGFDLIPI